MNEAFVNDDGTDNTLHDMEDIGQVLLEARKEYVAAAQDGGGVHSREMITPRQRKALTVGVEIVLLIAAATSCLLLPPSSITAA